MNYQERKDEMLKENLIYAVTLVLIVLILFSSILVGQHLRNERAASVEGGSYSINLVAPEDYRCHYDYVENAPNVLSVVCQPFK